MDTAPSLAELLHQWRDFYVLIGSASATLVALLFVAASIGSSIFNEKNVAPLSAFLTPTVVHFGALLFTCLLAIMPTLSWRVFGGLLAAGGLTGFVYCSRIVVQMVFRRRFKVDLGDRVFYAMVPTLGYLLLLASAALSFAQSAMSVDLLAAALLVLLLAGLRNAWDMTLWVAITTPGGRDPPPPEGQAD